MEKGIRQGDALHLPLTDYYSHTNFSAIIQTKDTIFNKFQYILAYFCDLVITGRRIQDTKAVFKRKNSRIKQDSKPGLQA